MLWALAETDLNANSLQKRLHKRSKAFLKKAYPWIWFECAMHTLCAAFTVYIKGWVLYLFVD